MKRNAIAAAVFCTLVGAVGGLHAETITWTGAGDGTSWSQTANWDPVRLPNGNDVVVIPDVAGTTVIVVASGASCGSLTSAENIQITGGDFYLYGTGTVNADLTLSTDGFYRGASTGTMTVNGHLTWTSGQLFQITIIANGTMEIAGTGSKTFYSATLENRGVASWYAGNLVGYSTLRNASGAELTVYADGDPVQASGGLFDNQGTFALGAGVSAQVQSSFQNSGTVRVESGTLTLGTFSSSGTFDLVNSSAILLGPPSSGSISLNGTASITGAGTFRVQSWCYLNGTHQIDAGVELLSGANFYLAAAAAVAVDGPFTTTGSPSVHGLTGGVLTLNGPVTLNSGTFGTITTTANGNVSVGGNTVVSGAVFENHGIVTWTAGNISVPYGGIFRIAPDAEFHAYANGGSILASYYGGTFDNQGEVVVEPNVSVTLSATSQNSGTLRVESGGSLTLGAHSSSGTIDLGDGAVVISTGSLSLNGTASITGTGTLRLQSICYCNGTHQIGAGVEVLGGLYVYAATTVNGPLTAQSGCSVSGGTGGVLTLNGPVTLNGGSFGTITTIANGDVTVGGTTSVGGVFENHGIVTWNAGNIAIGSVGVLRMAPNAELHAYANGGLIYRPSGPPGELFDNQGQVVVEPGVSATLSATSQNSGTVRVESGGSLTLGAHSSSGTIDLGDGAVVISTGSLSLNGTASITGTGTLRLQSICYCNGTHQIGAGVEVLGGLYVYAATTVNGPLTAQPGCSISGGTGGVLTLNGPVTLNGGNFGTITTIANGDVTVGGTTSVGGVFENHGIVTWNVGNIAIGSVGVLRIAPNAELHAYANGGLIYRPSGPPGELFDNQGALIIEPGVSVTIAASFQSSGPIDVQSGTLTISNGTISGNIFVDTGAVLEAAGITLGGNANITGTGTLRVNGGCGFAGTHVIEVPVEHVGGDVSVNGTATFNGPYNHTADYGWLTGSPGALTILNGDVTWVGGHLGGGCDENGACPTIIVNGNTTADFPGGCDPPTPNWCWLFGTLENHGVFTQTGWLRICGGGSFVNYGQHQHYGCVSCCTYSCGDYFNAGLFGLYGAGNNGLLGSNSGDVVIGAGSTLSVSGTYTQSSGSTTLNGGTLAASGVNLQGGGFYGTGYVNGNVFSNSYCSPGFSPGRIDVTGTYTQNAPGALATEIAGPDPGTGYDVVAITGAATLAGTLTVTHDPGYSPPVGAAFDILTAQSLSGEFVTENLAPLTGAKLWRLTYLPQAVRLEVVSGGDLNCDGAFDLADVAPFAQALADPAGYMAEHPTCILSHADMNGDDLVNGEDVQPLVDALLAG